MLSEQLSTVLISAAGLPGQHGTRQWDTSNDHEAQLGIPGRNGRHAVPPSCGSPGFDLALQVCCSPEDGTIVIEPQAGYGPESVECWTVSPAQDLFIDCHGGDGGHGGVGENGQPGGQGEKGMDATQYHNASSGRQGYRGGDGGLGTNGADGGDAGHLYMTLEETDMDSLIAMRWNVEGGAGGESGVHGARGVGGRGGRGGAGCSWTETQARTYTDSYGNTRTEYYTTHHSRPPGNTGPDGPPGRQYTQPLSAGRSGADGFCQIRLLRRNGGDEVYSGRYQLVVQAFDVFDENQDGINEPGEFLMVTNIAVQNIGDMPSPRYNPLHVHVAATPWLEPDMTKLLELPRGIPPGATMAVPGVLRALIKNEQDPRPPGTSLCAQDQVSLVAYSQRLRRRVPEFGGSQPVVYQYPLIMSQPKFLDAVAIGERVKFSWMIKNISSKPYGNAVVPRRQLWSCITDLTNTFDLMSAGGKESSPQSVTSLVDELEPGNEICVCQYLTVSTSAAAFSVGEMSVQLFLSDPHDPDRGQSRVVVHFHLCIQVSPPYQYNPLSNFLFVVNAQVPSQTILHLLSFVEHGLHLRADVFNLSLVGSFVAPDEKTASLFLRYVGKTIIVFANTIPYFQNGTRLPWDLMNPWEVCRLAAAGTSFLLVYPGDMDHLRNWASQLALPAHEFPPSLEVHKPKEVLAQLAEQPCQCDAPIPSLAVKKKIFRSLDASAASRAKSLRRQLDRQFPLRRFLVAPFDDLSGPTLRAAVAVSEGLPHEAQITAVLAPEDPAAPTGSLLTAMVVMSIPFADRCRMFWNMISAGHAQASGMSARTLYTGGFRGIENATEDDEKRMVDPKALEVIPWSISSQLTSEISSFCRHASWPSLSPNTHLPLLEMFINTAPRSAPEETRALVNTILSPALAIPAPLSFAQWLSQNIIRLGNRKRKIRTTIHHSFDRLLTGLYGPEQGKAASRTRKKLSGEVKHSLAEIKRDNPSFSTVDCAHEYCSRRLAEIALVPRGGGFVELAEIGGVVERSLDVSKDELAGKRRLQEELLVRIERDRAWSEQMLADMVT